MHINSGTESAQKGAFDSSTNVLQEEHVSLDESFPYSKSVILVRSSEDAYDKGSSGDVRNSGIHTPNYDSICSEDDGGYSHESSTGLGNEGQDKIPGDDVVHKEDVLEKNAEDVKATSSDEDYISIIDCPSCENSTNNDQVKHESIAVKQSLPSSRVSGIGNGDQPEDDISCNGYLQNFARMYSKNHSDSNSSIGVEVISSGTATRTGDAECSKNDSVHDCDRCSDGDYNLVVPFADDSDDIYLPGRGDGNLGIDTTFRSENGEAECTDADANAGHADLGNGALGGTNFRSCGCDDEVIDDDDSSILGKVNKSDDDCSHLRVLNDDDNDHNKKDNDDSDEDETNNSGKDNNKNSDKNDSHDDVNAKDDGDDQFFQQSNTKRPEKDSFVLLVEKEQLNEGRC